MEIVAHFIPAASLNEQSIDIAPVCWFLFYFWVMGDVVQELKLEVQLINRDWLLTSIILKTACDESLREEEPTHPEISRSAPLDPIIQEPNS